MIVQLFPDSHLTACTRSRISRSLIGNSDGFEVVCAAGDAGR